MESLSVQPHSVTVDRPGHRRPRRWKALTLPPSRVPSQPLEVPAAETPLVGCGDPKVRQAADMAFASLLSAQVARAAELLGEKRHTNHAPARGLCLSSCPHLSALCSLQLSRLRCFYGS